ncbi:MAG: hypothetical protein U9O53_01295 [archaeon]|nr:hypothetical protein [archaeon]
MSLLKGIKDKITGCSTTFQEYDAITNGIDSIIKSGYKANNVYNPDEHKVLIETYSNAMEKLGGMSLLKKRKQKKICSMLKADIEEQNDTFKTVYDSILGIEEPSVKTATNAVEDAPVIDEASVKATCYESIVEQQAAPIEAEPTNYTKKLQNVYSSVKDTVSTVKDKVIDNVPKISAEELRKKLELKALFNPRATYAAGLLAILGTRTATAMLSKDFSSLNLSDLNGFDFHPFYSNLDLNPSDYISATDYTGNLTADLEMANQWEDVITHPDFTPTQDFEEAFGRLYGMDASEISNLPEELQERFKEIWDIYAVMPVDIPTAESLGNGTLIEWGGDGKDIYTAANIDELIEKVGSGSTNTDVYQAGDITIIAEDGMTADVIYMNDDRIYDPHKGGIGALIEIKEGSETETATKIADDITRETAIRDLLDRDKESIVEIAHDKTPMDNNDVPTALAAVQNDGAVIKSLEGDNGNTYILIGYEPEGGPGMTNELDSAWGQLNLIEEKYSGILHPSGGGGGGNGGTAPDDGGSGGGRDGGDEY